MLLLLISISFLIITSIYFKLSLRYKYFSKHGIPGSKPKFLFGNTKESFLGRRNVTYDIDDIYRHFKCKSPFAGFFMQFTPYFLIIDPELLKNILIKDFGTFRNNDFSKIANEKKNPIMSLNPFLLTDDLWKVKRAEASPAMSQNKLKAMYPLVLDVTKRLIEYIDDEQMPIDVRDMCSRYTCDVMALCLFDIDGLSLILESAEFYDHSKRMMKGVIDATVSIFPRKMFPNDSEKFFTKLVKDAVRHRVENKIDRDDFLTHLISSQQKKNLNELELVAQAWTLYMDSFETGAIGLHYIFYELAKDKRVQDKLRNEIIENLGDDEHLSFEKILELEYLDQVFYEALRLNPPLTYTTKIASSNYDLEGTKGHKFTMEKGSTALISIYSLHRDREYYPHPDNFEPERFNAENGGVKAFRDKCVLLPFGSGPRICLGQKWAYVMLKSAIVEVLKNYRITVDDQVLKEPKMSAKDFMNLTECKLLLNFEKI